MGEEEEMKIGVERARKATEGGGGPPGLAQTVALLRGSGLTGSPPACSWVPVYTSSVLR